MQQESSYELVSAVFIKLLAVVYFIAFASLSGQIVALAGHDGILPITEMLQQANIQLDWTRFLAYPTIFWINAGDTALTAATWIGCAFSVLLFLNYKTRFSLVILYILYLSLFYAGQIFMHFQWDFLLMEAGFLAIFLTPNSRVVIFLYRWLLFRLRFLSGISKVLSNDPGWAGLSALVYYFETQPLPHIGGWYAHQLPEWLLMIATAVTLFIELVVPFMMFMARKYRFIAAWLTIALQIVIMLTSNHNWFNILTIILCLFLFDDQAIRKVLPNRLSNWLIQKHPVSTSSSTLRVSSYLLAAVIMFVSTTQIWEMVTGRTIEGKVGTLLAYIQRWSLSNKYHVFPTVNQQRTELIIEGTADGRAWSAYKFKYKPDDLNKTLAVVIPHHPRLDWMLWFVPLHPDFTPWFENFLGALLDNSPAVTAQLAHNPFTNSPPIAVKVTAFDYRFTNADEHKMTGNWWRSRYLGPFPPVPGLRRDENQRR